MAVRRLRPRRRACRRDVHADPDREVERHRSAGLARRCPRPHQRSQYPKTRSAPALELEDNLSQTRRMKRSSHSDLSCADFPAVLTVRLRDFIGSPRIIIGRSKGVRTERLRVRKGLAAKGHAAEARPSADDGALADGKTFLFHRPHNPAASANALALPRLRRPLSSRAYAESTNNSRGYA